MCISNLISITVYINIYILCFFNFYILYLVGGFNPSEKY